MKKRTEFAKWYRDMLNIEQKRKMKMIIDSGGKIENPERNYVTLEAVLLMFNAMENDFFYNLKQIKEKLCDELLLKGLITEVEHKEKLSEND